MEVRLGDLLIESGVLNADQVEAVLAEQQETAEPFGVIAERMFAVDPAEVEAAWARQYAGLTRKVDLASEDCAEKARALVSRRQAWQFRVVPVRFDDGELMLATTCQHLPRALRFACHVLGYPVYFVMAEADALGEALCRYYPLPGLTPEAVNDGSLDRVLTCLSAP